MLDQAADRVSMSYDRLEELFERLYVLVEWLEVRARVPMNKAARKLAVKGLVKVLEVLALATRMLKRGRMGVSPSFDAGCLY